MKATLKANLHKYILFFFLAICALKILMVGYDIDEQYAISMSYRLLQGDFPVIDMWEPHQTSAYLIALLMLPYIAITNSLTGIVLYLRFCGLLIHTLIIFVLYKHLKQLLVPLPKFAANASSYAFLLSCICFFSLPKLMFLPEFSNMQLWFLLLTILHILNYYHHNTLRNLVFAGLFMTLEVLTYPSTIIAFFVIVLFIIVYRKEKGLLKELTAFIAPSFAGLCLFLGYLLSRMSFAEFVDNIKFVFQDGSHSVSFLTTLENNLCSLGEIFFFILLYGTIAFIAFVLLRKNKGMHDLDPLYLYHILLISITLVGQIFIWLFANKYPNYPSIEYFLLPILGTYFAQKKKEKFPHLFSFFVLVPFSAFLGIVIFTNHPILVSAPFLSLCIIGLLCIYCKYATHHSKSYHALRYLLLLWIIVLLFGKLYMIRTSDGKHYTVFHDVSLIRQGPAIGIIADTNTVKQYKEALFLAESYLPDGTKLFYAGRSSGIYLFKDYVYSTPSTISTPTYDEKTLHYFNTHPDKMPDYIVCDINLKDLRTDSWLSRYIDTVCSSEPVEMYFYYLYKVDK